MPTQSRRRSLTLPRATPGPGALTSLQITGWELHLVPACPIHMGSTCRRAFARRSVIEMFVLANSFVFGLTGRGLEAVCPGREHLHRRESSLARILRVCGTSGAASTQLTWPALVLMYPCSPIRGMPNLTLQWKRNKNGRTWAGRL